MLHNEVGEQHGRHCVSPGSSRWRQTTETAMNGGDHRYRELVDRLPAAIYMCDAQGRITFYNKAAAVLWGREPELGKDLWCGSWRIFWPDGSPMPLDQCPMAISVREGRPVRGEEIVIERPDGSRRHVLPHPEPIFDGSGAIVGTSNMLVDITERREVETVSARLAAIVESSDDAIVSKTLEGIVTSWNKGAERIFGYLPEEAIGRPITFLMPPDRQDEEQRILARLRRGERVDHVETKRLTKDGRLIDVSLTISPIRNTRGEIVGASKIARDITRQKEAEAALTTWNKTLETLVAARTTEVEQRADQLRLLASELSQTEQRERRRLAQVLHDDIQQLLVAIKLQASIGHKNAGQPESFAKVTHLVDKAIATCRTLTVSLSPPVLRDGNLVAVMHWLSRHMDDHHGLHVEVTTEDPTLDAPDNLRMLLFAIVQELLFNVVKHAGVGRATVRLGVSDGRIGVEVADEGRGCESASLEAPRPDSFGLFSIRERLAIFGGTFNLRTKPGGGCQVRIHVPLSQPPDSPSPSSRHPQNEPIIPAASCQGVLRVLLADDHQIVRQGLAELLASQPGTQVIAQASDGREAVALARTLKPDVVVMDISMPQMNGVEATRLIRAEMPDVRVVGLSMHEEADMDSVMRAAGADAYVNKDGPIEQLLDAIRGGAKPTPAVRD